MFDFDELIDRRSTLSYKWAIPEGELPMWIADMDIRSPEPVRRAIAEVAEEGIYGYSVTPKELFASVADYFKRRHGATLSPSDMLYSNGAIAGVAACVRALSEEGDKVLVQAPVYNNFYSAIEKCRRIAVSSDLLFDGEKYSIDFDDLEAKLLDESVRLMIVCNPHNPVGRIWTQGELSRIAELAAKHGVKVISDEVHCDFVNPGLHYTPFYMASELAASISCTIVSGSKTFNMAGLQTGFVIAKNEEIRKRVSDRLDMDELSEPNVFASRALIAGYTECDEWIDALADYVYTNRLAACKYIKENCPELKPVSAASTYLLWVDVSAVEEDADVFVKRLRELTGLYVSAGSAYGESGRGFVRINLATQRSRVMDGMERLARGVKMMMGE